MVYPTNYSRSDVSRSGSYNARATLFLGDGSELNDLDLLAGSLSVNARGRIRRTCRAVFRGWRDEIDPADCELKLERAVNDEFVPLGMFRVEDPEFVLDQNGGPITTVEGYDRFYLLQQLRMPTQWTIPHLTPLNDAITDLLAWRYPTMPVEFDLTNHKVSGVTFEEQSDPLEKAMDIVDSAGLDLYSDVNGVARMRQLSEADESQVAVTFGTEARIIKSGAKRSTKQTYSHAIAIAENPALAAPLRSDQYDDDPSSKTYYLGNFGDRPTWIRSQMISTQDQCDAAAVGLLARKSGRIVQYSITGIPDPALDAYDVIRIYQSSEGVDQLGTVETITFPLVGGEMAISTRERRVA